MFDLSIVWDYRGALLQGLWVTFWISMLSILLGFCVGALTCFVRTSGPKWMAAVATVYVSAFRGTPLLVQLVIIFYILPIIGISVPPAMAAVIALSLNSGAFQAEILRGGFQTLPNGQVEAALDFGFSPWQSLIHIELPQVFSKTLPALINETVDIIKNSSLISTVAVTELMRVSQQYSSTTYRYLEFIVAAGLMYLVLTVTVSRVGQMLERKLSH